MTREEQLDWLRRLRSDVSYMDFSIDVEVSLKRKEQYRQVLSEVIKTLEQEPVINKIRAEIEQLPTYDTYTGESYLACNYKYDVLQVINNHRMESKYDRS